MLRNILLLVASVIGFAILRNLLREAGRFVSQAVSGSKGAAKRQNQGAGSAAKLSRDPQTGTYVDPRYSVSATVNGKRHHFESEASRDAYMRANS